ncbi:MAG: hypothetical protein ACLQKA_10230 [Bryobacteraceae bacterium]
MGLPANPSFLRAMLGERLALLVDEVDRAAREATRGARQECADQLNQALRRLCQAGNQAELADTLADAAAQFAGGAAVLSIEDGTAKLESVRPSADARSAAGAQTALEAAPALRAAIESREPVIAAAAESEVGETLAGLAASTGDDRLAVFPVTSHQGVPALVCAWGTVEAAAVELLAQVTGAEWERVVRAAAEAATAAAAEMANMAPAERTWDSLSAAEKQTHFRAQRFARVRVAQWRLRDGALVRTGRARGDLYDEMKAQIDEARTSFRHEFFAACPGMIDYLHLEMVHTLANDDAELLGKDYPGPLL